MKTKQVQVLWLMENIGQDKDREDLVAGLIGLATYLYRHQARAARRQALRMKLSKIRQQEKETHHDTV